MKKEYLFKLVASVMVVSVLMGCGSKANNSVNAGENGTTENTTEEQNLPTEEQNSLTGDETLPTGDEKDENASDESEEPEVKQTYFEENNLEITDIQQSFTTTGLLVQWDDVKQEMDFSINETTDVAYQMQEITKQAADQDGYDKITVSYTATVNGYAQYDEEWEVIQNMSASSVASLAVADKYTGRINPGENTMGDASLLNEITVEYDGKSYDVSVSKDIQWVSPGWEGTDDIFMYRYTNVEHVTITIIVPTEYDGLILYYSPCDSYDEAEVTAWDDKVASGEAIYLDEVKEDATVYMDLSSYFSK